jgi:hypothetical protein
MSTLTQASYSLVYITLIQQLIKNIDLSQAEQLYSNSDTSEYFTDQCMSVMGGIRQSNAGFARNYTDWPPSTNSARSQKEKYSPRNTQKTRKKQKQL